ncbi:MAG: DMT family transporter [Telluria sp.]
MPSLWMLLATFLFALMSACVKLASATFSTSEIVFSRGVIGAVMLYAMTRHRGGSFGTPLWREHLWRGVVGVVSLWLWFVAIARLPLATAVTLNYMSPIWIAVYLFLAGWWHDRKHLEWPLVAAILCSFVGVTLVLRPAIEAQQWAGGLMGLASGMLSALAYLQVRKLGLMGEPEYRVVFYFSLSNVAAGLAGIGIEGARFAAAPTPASWLLLAGLGVFATLAQVAMTRAYRVGSTLVVANLQYSGIIFSSILGALLWRDRFDWHVWTGIGIILVSGIAATFYNTRSTSRGTAIDKTDPIASET